MIPRHLLGLPAPAKVNLFLHVTGRRPDGYHELESVFVPIALADRIDVVGRDDDAIVRQGDLLGPEDQDLAVRAARALQQAAGIGRGAEITVHKRIPAGSGMGGGSSDAATTLIALNHLWDLRWPVERLVPLAARLGADVPFFLGAGPAFVEGIGDVVTPLVVPPLWMVVIHPQVHVSTREIFADPALTRNTSPKTISGFSIGALSDSGSGGAAAGLPGFPGTLPGTNDLEPVARRHAPPIAEAIAALNAAARAPVARMTGSGSAVFAVFGAGDMMGGSSAEAAAQAAAAQVRAACEAQGRSWSIWVVSSLQEHPLAAWSC